MTTDKSRPQIGLSWWTGGAVWIWLLVFVAICADVVHRPLKHTTMPTYRQASTQWWQGIDPYSLDPHAGFLYFPQAAFLFTPFNVLPFILGEIAWRAATFGLFAYALVRLNTTFLAGKSLRPDHTFFLLSLLAIPSAFASLRNAQFDLPLAALIVLAAAEIATARWTPAAAWLCLALALKPLAVVPMLLFGALYWKLIPRLAAGILIVLALPFLHWSPAYVAHEYVRCFETLVWAAKGDEPKFSDLAALLSQVGIHPPEALKTATRVLFALIYLGLGAMATRRLPLPNAAWTIGALSADYLMLFNPRTETCSYVFLGPFVASFALLVATNSSRRWLSYALAFAALGLACDAIPVVHDYTDRWLKPLIALLFLPVLIDFIFQRTSGHELSETEFKSTFGEKMITVSEEDAPRADIWKYIRNSRIQLQESVLKNETVERVYRSASDRYDHVLIPIGERNVFLVIVVDRKHCTVLGHRFLDLNIEYGLTTKT